MNQPGEATPEAQPDAQMRRAQARLGAVLRGKWRIDRLLGVGGMAAVYAGTHRNGQRGAIKMLHAELSADEQMRARFLREGYVANRVGHPGAVSVLDDDVAEDGSVFLVMELLQGRSLGEIAQSRPGQRLGLREALGMADQLLGVLGAAHAQGVVHRDIKPDNLFLTDAGVLKILDFGIARMREEPGAAAKLTRTGSAMGTPAFMPPEQALGEWARVDGRTDLWAVGASLYTLTTGRLVHEADTLNKLLLKAMTANATPFAKVVPDAPGEVAEVIDRALAFTPEKRWADAAAMQRAVRKAMALVDDRPLRVEAAPPGTVGLFTGPVSVASAPTVPRVPKRSAPLAMLAGAAIGFVVMGGVVTTWALRRTGPTSPSATALPAGSAAPPSAGSSSAAPIVSAAGEPSGAPATSASPPPSASAAASAARPRPSAGAPAAKGTPRVDPSMRDFK
jgi:serine/threonine-protein kinase